MNTTGVNVIDSPTPANLFDEFEEAYLNCLGPLTKEDNLISKTIPDELKANAELNAQKFLELARQMEAFFLQKRYLLAVQKPELIQMEDVAEMKSEIVRKDELIKKHTGQLADWQGQLLSLQTRAASVPTTGPRPPMMGGAPHHMSMMQGGPVSPQVAMSGMSPVGGPMAPGSMGHPGPTMSHNMNPNMGMAMGPGAMMGQVGGNMGGPMVGMAQGGYQSNIGGMPTMPSGMPINASSMHTGMPGPANSMSGPPGAMVGSGDGSMVGGGPGMGLTGTGGHMQPGGVGMYSVGGMGQTPGGLQGPLAFLEKTTTNIGMPDPRR